MVLKSHKRAEEKMLGALIQLYPIKNALKAHNLSQTHWGAIISWLGWRIEKLEFFEAIKCET